MTVHKSNIVAGKASVVTAGVAGVVVAQYAKIFNTSGAAFNQADVFALCVLPEGARLTDVQIASGTAADAAKIGYLDQETGGIAGNFYSGAVVANAPCAANKAVWGFSGEGKEVVIGVTGIALADKQFIAAKIEYAF